MARPKKQSAKTRKDGNFEAKVTIGKDMHGKPIRKSFYSSVSVEDAKKKGEEYRIQREIETRTGTFIADEDMTFGKWATKWLETYKKPNVNPNSYTNTYETPLYKHILPYFGKAHIASIRNADVQTFINSKSELSESYLDKIVITLNQIFNAAIDNELCYKNPCKNVKARSDKNSKSTRHYSDEEMKLVTENTTMPEIIVMMQTGLRRGEVLGLTWADIDFKNYTLSVNRSISDISEKGKRCVEIFPPKHNSYRTIPISRELAKMLSKIPKKSVYIFPNEKGELYSPNLWQSRYRREMQRLEATTGVKALRAHELRHTAGTAMSRHGVDIFTIQKILGHKDIKLTTNLYVHDEVERLRNALQKSGVI